MEAERLAAFLSPISGPKTLPSWAIGAARLQLKRGITAHFSSIRSPNHREIF
jgi:hypothetical protein